MNTDTLQALERLSKASKHAHQLRASFDKLLYLLPEAHDTWHRMAKETRQIEAYLETMLEIIQEMLERDPSSYAAIFLSPPEPTPEPLPADALSATGVHTKAHRNGIFPCAYSLPPPPSTSDA